MILQNILNKGNSAHMVEKNTIKKSALTPTVVIAGGAGFIGSHLAKILLDKGARVIVFDNFSTGKKNLVEPLLSNQNFALFDVNINNGIPPEVESADYVFHLAGLESYQSSEKSADLESLLTNAVGTKNLLDFTKNCSGKFLLASSTDVYQGQLSPLDLSKYFGHTEEEENRFELAEAKRFAEAMVWEYFRNYDADVRIVRLPEVFGPGMDEGTGGELGDLIRQLTEGPILDIRGDGLNKSYYLYIEDTVSGLTKALLNPKTKGKIFTLVEKEPYTTLEISYLLKNMANQQIEIKFDKSVSAPRKNLIAPDTSNHPILKWHPKIGFREGIRKTLKSMGYEVNEDSFKLGKLIEKKAKEKQEELYKEPMLLNTLQNLKSIESQEQKPKKIRQPSKLAAKIKSMFGTKEVSPKTYVKKTKEIKENITSLTPLKPPITISKSKNINFVAKTNVLDGGIIGTKEPLTPVKTSKKVLMGGASFLLAAVIILIGLPIIQTYVYAKVALNSLEKIPTTLGQLQSEQGKEEANKAFQNFHRAKNSFGRLKWLYKITNKRDEFNSMIKTMSSATYFSEAMYNTSKATIPFNNIWEVIKPNSEDKLNEESFSQARVYLKTANDAINLAEAEFKNVTISALPKSLEKKAYIYEALLQTTSQRFEELTTYIADVSELLGVGRAKKYLILLQNSNEIRPTGGFIGSYAVLEIDKGKITNLEINDIYDPDGQLDTRNIAVTPPKPISEFLNEDKLHIRNANWDPDFTESAKVIQDLFFRLDGQVFDGVIGIDLEFSKQILELTGPVFLTSYNEEITADNLEEKAQFYSEFNYEEGASQKKSFLSMLTSKMLEKMFALPKENTPALISHIQSLLNGRHLMLYMPGTSISRLLKEKGWDGNMISSDGDYLYIVNANLGGTKANYYVKNNYSYKISSDTRDGVLRAELTLNFVNNAETNAWPGGPYTDYLRIFTKKGAKLTGAQRGGIDIFKEIITTETQYTSFETHFTLNPKEEISLVITYDLPAELFLEKDVRDYYLYWQKQPGTKDDRVTFEYVPPMGLEVSKDGGKLENILNEDWKIKLTLK